MAIYHLHAKTISRARGQSAVAAAAYRSGALLYEEPTGITHDYTRKEGVEHSEILAPEGAPTWVFDRHTLWNTVEAHETRKDSQVAREIEVGLPIELSESEQIALLRDYVRREFVSKGMVVDIGVHRDNPNNPHAHLLMTTRDLRADGFGPKNRSWNAKSELLHWRRAWAEVTNEYLIEAGLGVRIDHRSYAEQKLELIPGRKIGVGKEREAAPDLPGFIGERIAEQHKIAAANGNQIIEDPEIALQALVHSQSTFSHHDVARFLHTRTRGAEQFQRAYLKVTTSPELVGLGKDDLGRERYTTKEMLATEVQLLHSAEHLAVRGRHGVDESRRSAVLTQHRLSAEQSQAVHEVTGAGDLKVLVGVAGSGKSATLSAMRQVWEGEGYSVKGATLAGIAAENLESSAGIDSRTIASYELAWNGGRDPLTPKDVLVIDEAGMIGTRQLQRVLSVAAQARAKVVLVGDPEQLQAIEAGAPFRGIAAKHGMSSLTEVHRQKEAWQRSATRELSVGKTANALAAYEKHGGIVPVETRGDARSALLARWAYDAKREPQTSQLVLAYTRADVRSLNESIRALRQQNKQLGKSQSITSEQGKREFAANDRIRFLRNEKTLGVKNGSLGTVEKIEHGVLQIKLDGPSESRVAVDTKFYGYLDHGYAATVHKAQGSTVDRTYVLATPHFDRHTAYVALSRHRETATLFYGAEDFGGRAPGATEESVKARFAQSLSRERSKDLVHDYLERTAADVADQAVSLPRKPARPRTPEEIQAAARERWLAYREQIKSGQIKESDLGRSADVDRGRDQDRGLEQSDDDMGL